MQKLKHCKQKIFTLFLLCRGSHARRKWNGHYVFSVDLGHLGPGLIFTSASMEGGGDQDPHIPSSGDVLQLLLPPDEFLISTA